MRRNRVRAQYKEKEASNDSGSDEDDDCQSDYGGEGGYGECEQECAEEEGYGGNDDSDNPNQCPLQIVELQNFLKNPSFTKFNLQPSKDGKVTF